MSVKEMAKGIIYDDPIKTRLVLDVLVTFIASFVLVVVAHKCFMNPPWSWSAPRYILNMPETRHERVRKKFHILVDGDTIPFPIKSFREMKFPPGCITLPSVHFKSMQRGPKCWRHSLKMCSLFSVCSDPERLEKEGHCSPHANSDSGNPHSVSTVDRLFPLSDSSVHVRLDVLHACMWHFSQTSCKVIDGSSKWITVSFSRGEHLRCYWHWMNWSCRQKTITKIMNKTVWRQSTNLVFVKLRTSQIDGPGWLQNKLQTNHLRCKKNKTKANPNIKWNNRDVTYFAEYSKAAVDIVFMCPVFQAGTWLASPSPVLEKLLSSPCPSSCSPWSRRSGCPSTRGRGRTASSSAPQ